jgi:hypothetical protein
MAAEPLLAAWVEPFMDPRWLYGIRSAITAAVLLYFWRAYVELRGGSHATALGWLGGVAVGVVVFVLWIKLDFSPLVLGEAEDPFDPLVTGRIHAGLAFVRLAGAVLVVPLMEELFWRSFLMRWLERRNFLGVAPGTVGWTPLLMTSVVFAVEHRLWFAGLVAGLAYGELYRRTGDIRVVILAHALTNGLLGAYVLATASWAFW